MMEFSFFPDASPGFCPRTLYGWWHRWDAAGNAICVVTNLLFSPPRNSTGKKSYWNTQLRSSQSCIWFDEVEKFVTVWNWHLRGEIIRRPKRVDGYTWLWLLDKDIILDQLNVIKHPHSLHMLPKGQKYDHMRHNKGRGPKKRDYLGILPKCQTPPPPLTPFWEPMFPKKKIYGPHYCKTFFGT